MLTDKNNFAYICDSKNITIWQQISILIWMQINKFIIHRIMQFVSYFFFVSNRNK